MFSMRAMTPRENGPTCRYRAISATIQRIESGLPDMHWLNVLRKNLISLTVTDSVYKETWRITTLGGADV